MASSCVPHPGDLACHSGLSQLGFLSALAGLSTCGFLSIFVSSLGNWFRKAGFRWVFQTGSCQTSVPGQLSLATFRLPFPGFPEQVHRMVFRDLHPTALFHGELTPSRSAVPGDRHLKWCPRPQKGQTEKSLERLLPLSKHTLCFYSDSLTWTTGVACLDAALLVLVPAAPSHSYFPTLPSGRLTSSFTPLEAPRCSYGMCPLTYSFSGSVSS